MSIARWSTTGRAGADRRISQCASAAGWQAAHRDRCGRTTRSSSKRVVGAPRPRCALRAFYARASTNAGLDARVATHLLVATSRGSSGDDGRALAAVLGRGILCRMRTFHLSDGGGSLTITSDDSDEPWYWRITLKSGGLNASS